MNISDKYGKYIVELKLLHGTYYSVWGTNEKSEDLFFTMDNKVVLFNNISLIKNKLDNNTQLFDKKNFKMWIENETFLQPYSSIDFTSLLKFDYDKLNNLQFCNEILNSLNIIKDLFYQLNENKLIEIYDDDVIVSLKDFLNDKVLWQEKRNAIKFPEEVKLVLEKIYTEFLHRTVVVKK